MIALLFMKENSERLPNKNIKNFNDHFLFYWIFNTLMQIKFIDKIILNTDSMKIAKLVIAYFGDVVIHMRPDWLCGDKVVANEIIDYEINHFNYNNNQLFLQTHVTNPLLQVSTIINAIKFYNDNLNKYDSLFTVTEYQGRFYNNKGQPINHKINQIEQTQNMEPIYEDNSCLYLFSKESFNKNGRVGLNPKMYEINKIEAIDIDTQEDWIIAEGVAKCDV